MMWRHLYDAEAFTRVEVDIEPPAKILVERLGTIDVGNS